MSTLTLIYGGLTIAMVLVAWFAARGSDLLTVSLLIAATWIAGVAATRLLPFPLALLTYPPTDFVAGVMIAHIWERRPSLWKMVVLCSLITEIICHFVFWLNGAAWWRGIYYRYALALNMLFLVQLGAVIGPGLWDVAGGDDLVRRLRGRAGAHHPAVSRAAKRD